MSSSRAFDQFHLSGAWNFRDVGGLHTDSGATVRPGILFRSSQLADLEDDGRTALTELGVTDVFDLRSDNERERAGSDAVPDGVRMHEISFDESQDASAAAPHEAPVLDSPERAREFMDTVYAALPIRKGGHKAIAELIHTIADGSGAVLVHCAAGKDRAGWAMATVLRAAGVSDADVLADYLRSNDAVEPLKQMLIDKLGDKAVIQDNMLGVREDYYRIAMDTVQSQYGSFEGYLDEIGIDSDTLARLRSRLLD